MQASQRLSVVVPMLRDAFIPTSFQESRATIGSVGIQDSLACVEEIRLWTNVGACWGSVWEGCLGRQGKSL